MDVGIAVFGISKAISIINVLTLFENISINIGINKVIFISISILIRTLLKISISIF